MSLLNSNKNNNKVSSNNMHVNTNKKTVVASKNKLPTVLNAFAVTTTQRRNSKTETSIRKYNKKEERHTHTQYLQQATTTCWIETFGVQTTVRLLIYAVTESFWKHLEHINNWSLSQAKRKVKHCVKRCVVGTRSAEQFHFWWQSRGKRCEM